MVTLRGVVTGACEEDLSSDAMVRARAFFGPAVTPCIAVRVAEAEDIGTAFRAAYEAHLEHDWPLARLGDRETPCRECGVR